MNKFLKVIIVITIILLSSCSNGYKATFTGWRTFNNELSTINLTINKEKIDGKFFETVTITGIKPDSHGSYAGVYGTLDERALKEIREMTSFSFKVLGDGQSYSVRLPTPETMNGDHYMYLFETKKGETLTVNVNVPGDLIRWNWSNTEAEFIPGNVFQFQIDVHSDGDYNLKFWDIRFYK